MTIYVHVFITILKRSLQNWAAIMHVGSAWQCFASDIFTTLIFPTILSLILRTANKT